jgi:LDH2 family malate/lactate/ureidoglycolate dehydrogenase
MIWQQLQWQWVKFKLLKEKGHKVPLGTGLTKDGKDTTDPGRDC